MRQALLGPENQLLGIVEKGWDIATKLEKKKHHWPYTFLQYSPQNVFDAIEADDRESLRAFLEQDKSHVHARGDVSCWIFFILLQNEEKNYDF